MHQAHPPIRRTPTDKQPLWQQFFAAGCNDAFVDECIELARAARAAQVTPREPWSACAMRPLRFAKRSRGFAKSLGVDGLAHVACSSQWTR
jgi:hypothetical protein